MKSNRPPQPTVLIVEDEAPIRRFLHTALESEGCQVVEAGNCARGEIECRSRKPDLVIVDLGLPDGDGLTLIRGLRAWSSVPVLVLSARSEESEKVKALDHGADDYLTKPFGVAELLARVRALLRRALRPAADSPGPIQFGDIEIDTERRVVRRAGEPVHLTPIEFKLLGHLVANAGRVVTHRELLAQVWGPDRIEHTHYLRIYMAGLRRKLEADPAFPRHILTESGIGYRLAM